MTDSSVPVEATYEERSPFSLAGDAPLLERAIPVARMKGVLEARLTGTGLGASIGPDRRFPTVRAAVEYCSANDAGT